MLILDLLAAHANEGLHPELLLRYWPKIAAGELGNLRAEIGPQLYLEAIWNERIKESTHPPRQSSIAWPIKRIGNIIPLRRRR